MLTFNPFNQRETKITRVYMKGLDVSFSGQ